MCDVPYCRKDDLELIYYGKNICTLCWMKYGDNGDELKKILNVAEYKRQKKVSLMDYSENGKTDIHS